MTKQKLTIPEVFDKWKISKSFLAGKMGMKRNAFHKKLYKVESNRLNEAQEASLKSLLKELASDLLNAS